MKAITIQQPFATLIIEGIKEYEFRTCKTNYRGEVLIHAGISVNQKAMKKFEHYHFTYPTGCIIGKVSITDCILIDERARKMLKEKKCDVYERIIEHDDWNGYGFRLENPEKINPIKVSGKLGLWNYDEKWFITKGNFRFIWFMTNFSSL